MFAEDTDPAEPPVGIEDDEPPVGIDEDEPEAPATRALVDILPADFPLPALVKFVPDERLRLTLRGAVETALAVKVDGPDGMVAADAALGPVRAAIAAIEDAFKEPARIAYELHRQITSRRAEWIADGTRAVQTVGDSIIRERRRLEQIAAEERRKAQDEADRKAREDRQREAEAAKAAGAPKAAVKELEQQAKTATAPPVSRAVGAPPPLTNSTAVTRYGARLAGTPANDDANPGLDMVTPPQRLKVFELLKGILDGKAPLTCIELNWSYLNKRAAAEKTSFQMPGLEAYEIDSLRGKGRR